MSAIALFGALEIGLIYGLVGIGVLLTFRYLEFPDLTVEGSFPLGGAVTAAWIVGGGGAWSSLALAFGAGALSGLFTGLLTVHLGILHILAGILTMIALFSIIIRIMGKPNTSLLGEETIITPLRDIDAALYMMRPALMALIVGVVTLLLIRFLLSDNGLALRATGSNAQMVRANGDNTKVHVYMGLALSNGMVALGGALFTHSSGFADVTSGVGTIVVGLAAVILGEAIFRTRRIWLAVVAALVGSVLYRLAIAAALAADLFGMQASDLNMITAALVIVAMMAPRLRAWLQQKRYRK